MYFDAYENDYKDDPFISFTAEIYSFITKNPDKFQTDGKKKKDFIEGAAKVGGKLLGLGAKIAITSATAGAVKAADLDEIGKALTKIGNDASDFTSKLIEKKIEDYAQEKKQEEDFKTTLASFAAKYRESTGYPVTIIVDELDRCRPNFSLSLLERIKHLFDVENVVFLLFMNVKQLEAHISHTYGADEATHSYLQKFADLKLDLPVRDLMTDNDTRLKYIHHLKKHYSIRNFDDPDAFNITIEHLSKVYDLTAREIGKIFTILVVYYASRTTRFHDDFLIVLLAVFRVKIPVFYEMIKGRNTSFDEMLEKMNLEITKDENEDKGWMVDYARVYFGSDKQIDRAGDSGKKIHSLSVRGFHDRLDLAPFLCGVLDNCVLSG